MDRSSSRPCQGRDRAQDRATVRGMVIILPRADLSRIQVWDIVNRRNILMIRDQRKTVLITTSLLLVV